MAEHPMFSIIDEDIPQAQQQLRDSHGNLEKLAQYCRVNYLQAEDKRVALEDTKNYATQALASVAYQINAFSYHLLQLFDHQDVQLAETESDVRQVNQTVMIHKEKIARREIGALATTNKPMQRQHKVLPPPTPERAIRYTRKPIDYNIYDDLGHGLKISQPSHPRNGRKTSSNVTDSGSLSSAPSNATYDTGGIYRKTGGINPSLNLTNTLSRNQARNLSDYRTPVPPPPPVIPPSLGGHYGPSQVVNGTKQHVSSNTSSPHLNTGRGDYYHLQGGGVPQQSAGAHPSSHYHSQGSNGGTYGSSSSSSQQHSPLPTSAQAYYASQKQNFQFPSTQQPPRKLSSGSGGGGYGSLPVVNGKSHNTSTNISSPLPPPPPPSAGYGMGNGNVLRSSYNGVGKNEGSRNGGIQRALSHTDSVNTPPPPPPPPDVGMRTGVPEWAPKMFLEKVVAIYDYQADKEDELSFMENQVIFVIKKNDDGWYEGVMEGVRGLFPGNYVEPCA